MKIMIIDDDNRKINDIKEVLEHLNETDVTIMHYGSDALLELRRSYAEDEGNCGLGKEGTFRHKCQTCKTYKKKPGALPARTDNRKKKLERIRRKEDLVG